MMFILNECVWTWQFETCICCHGYLWLCAFKTIGFNLLKSSDHDDYYNTVTRCRQLMPQILRLFIYRKYVSDNSLSYGNYGHMSSLQRLIIMSCCILLS